MQTCRHCRLGEGCGIYEDRPEPCSDFYCGYRIDASLGEEWKPSLSKIVVAYDGAKRHIAFLTDPEAGDVWRRAPYFARLKQIAARAWPARWHVLVWQGLEVFAVLPDREVALGPVREDQVIFTRMTHAPTGAHYEVRVVERDDPCLAGVAVPEADS